MEKESFFFQNKRKSDQGYTNIARIPNRNALDEHTHKQPKKKSKT